MTSQRTFTITLETHPGAALDGDSSLLGWIRETIADGLLLEPGEVRVAETTPPPVDPAERAAWVNP